MKIIPLLLGLSVAANAALVVIVLRPSTRLMAGGAARGAEASVAAGPTNDRARPPATGVEADAAKGVAWSAVNAGSLKDLVARLRAAGYPTAAIRALVQARLAEEARPRLQALLAGLEESPYWKANRSFYNPKIAAAQREFYQEQMRTLKELLGPDAAEDNELSRYFRRRQYGDLPADKTEQLQRVVSDYSDMRNEIYATSNGMLMPEDRDKIAYLEKEQRADLAKILTPAELENYDLRSSSTANAMRSQLTTFQPSEEEFRALFRAARSLEDQYGSMQGPTSYEQMKQRQAAMNELAKQVLVPERYAEYAQATDPRYQTINRIAVRYELPATVVPQVYAVQQDIQQRAMALRSLPADQRTEPLQALVAEATTKLTPLLGDKAFAAYKVYGGQWLQQITRTPPPRPPGGPKG